MKTLTKLVLSLMLSASFAVVAQPEELKNSTPEERAEILTDMMKNALSLDEKAADSVSAINLKYAKKAQTLMDSDSPKIKKLMTFRENSKAKDAELKGVLSPAQYSQYEQKKSELRGEVEQKLMERSQAKE